MLLKHTFDKSEINLTLELFLNMLRNILGEQLLSVYLYGSVVFDDLSPGYGDFDFLVVTKDDIPDEIASKLIEMRKTLRHEKLGVYSSMLEGEFLPVKLLKLRQVGKGVYWGTRSERRTDRNEMGSFSYLGLKEKGLLIYGVELSKEFDDICNDILSKDIQNSIQTIREHGKSSEGNIFSVEWLFMAARAILWMRERKLSSKTESALWAYDNCKGDWRLHLLKAVDVRKSPGLINNKEISRWLGSLDTSIQEACDELERDFRKEKKDGANEC